PTPAQIRNGGFTDTKAAECAIAAVSGEGRASRVARYQGLLFSSRHEAHQRAERLRRRRHFQNRAEPDTRSGGFDLDVLTIGIADCEARPRSRIHWAVGSVLRVRQ